MKKLFLVLLLLAGSHSFAQGVRIGSAPSSLTTTTTTNGVNVVLTTVPNGNIHFCGAPANATPCTNYATTYTTSADSVACSNSTQVVLDGTSSCVANADSQGNWGVWVAPGQYTYTVTSGSNNYGPYFITAGFDPNNPPNFKSFNKLYFFEELYAGADAGARANAACTDATAKGGGYVVFPDGTLTINTTINGCNNVLFMGAGKDATVLTAGGGLGANRVFWANGSSGSHITNTGLKDMTVQNGTPSTGSATANQDGCRFDYTDGAYLDNVRFTSIQGNYGCTAKNSTKGRWNKVQVDNFTFCGLCLQTDNVDFWITDPYVDTATTTLTPAYGIGISGAEDTSGTNYSSDIHLINPVVKNILSWECIDTHGGSDQWIINPICTNSKHGLGVQVAQGFVSNPVGTRIHVMNGTFTQGTGANDGEGIFIQGNSGATLLTDSDFTNLTFTGYGPTATGTDIAGVVLLNQTRNLHFSNITCHNYNQACLMANQWNQDITIEDLKAVDLAGSKTSSLTANFIMRSLGNYGITIHGLTTQATTAAGAPSEMVRCDGVMDGGLIIDGISADTPPTTALFSNCAQTALNRAAIPTTQAILMKAFDPVYLTSGQIGATVNNTPGYFSFDTSDVVVTANMSSTQSTFVKNANGSVNGNASDLRWIPIGTNLTVAGAGPAAAALNCIVIANDLTTVTLATSAGAACTASTTVTGANVTYQGPPTLSANQIDSTGNIYAPAFKATNGGFSATISGTFTGNHTQTLPDANGTFSFAQFQDCGATSGATQNCAGTVKNPFFVIRGAVTLNGAATQSLGNLPFTAGGDYSCSGSDVTNAAGIVSFNTYAASSVVIQEQGGGVNDVLKWQCSGW